MEIVEGSIYDWPKYYDFIYGSDWKAEVQFIEFCAGRFANSKTGLYFEPACGTGRLLFQLARRGHRVSGIDLNEKAVNYCNDRLGKHGYSPAAFVADMRDFRVKKKVDVSFNTINSFRHLATDQDSIDHLQAMANATRKGGIYLLGLHLFPTDADADDHETWIHRRGHLQINASMWLEERNMAERWEKHVMNFDVYTPTRQFRIHDLIKFRIYTLDDILDLFRRVPDFDLVEVYDFAYDTDHPIELDGATQDALFVLRKE